MMPLGVGETLQLSDRVFRPDRAGPVDLSDLERVSSEERAEAIEARGLLPDGWQSAAGRRWFVRGGLGNEVGGRINLARALGQEEAPRPLPTMKQVAGAAISGGFWGVASRVIGAATTGRGIGSLGAAVFSGATAAVAGEVMREHLAATVEPFPSAHDRARTVAEAGAAMLLAEALADELRLRLRLGTGPTPIVAWRLVPASGWFAWPGLAPGGGGLLDGAYAELRSAAPAALWARAVGRELRPPPAGASANQIAAWAMEADWQHRALAEAAGDVRLPPNAFEPLLEVWRSGCAVESIDAQAVVLVCPVTTTEATEDNDDGDD